MMPTALALVTAFTLLTAAAAPAAPGDTKPVPAGPTTTALPPLSITVHATSSVSRALLARTLDEAGSIWRAAGVTIDWRVSDGGARTAGARELNVIVDDEPGRALDGELPIGWVVFDDERHPEPELHVSHGNARRLLVLARQTRGGAWMPRLEEEVLLGRAMGRALAHELGHYLFASKHHTRRGLMQGRRTAAEMFATAHDGYRIGDDERRLAAARIAGSRRVASTASSSVARWPPD